MRGRRRSGQGRAGPMSKGVASSHFHDYLDGTGGARAESGEQRPTSESENGVCECQSLCHLRLQVRFRHQRLGSCVFMSFFLLLFREKPFFLCTLCVFIFVAYYFKISKCPSHAFALPTLMVLCLSLALKASTSLTLQLGKSGITMSRPVKLAAQSRLGRRGE